jgi:hypothetical protein
MPYLYPYEAIVFQRDERWFEGISWNGVGTGWSPRSTTDDGRRLGVLRLSGDVPSGVREVVVAWNEREHRVRSAPATSSSLSGTCQAASRTRWVYSAVRYVYDDGTVKVVEPDPFLERAWKWIATPGGLSHRSRAEHTSSSRGRGSSRVEA